MGYRAKLCLEIAGAMLQEKGLEDAGTANSQDDDENSFTRRTERLDETDSRLSNNGKSTDRQPESSTIPDSAVVTGGSRPDEPKSTDGPHLNESPVSDVQPIVQQAEAGTQVSHLRQPEQDEPLEFGFPFERAMESTNDSPPMEGRLDPDHPLLRFSQDMLRSQLKEKKRILEAELREKQKAVKVRLVPTVTD